MTPTPGIGSTRSRPIDGMLMYYVPAGEFVMGLEAAIGKEFCEGYGNDCVADWFVDEMPAHSVFLDPFWIDRTEVTNTMYASCVEVGACPMPVKDVRKLPSSRYGIEGFEEFPVTNITWEGASAYCAWAGARLPTEAEWEKAARGTDGRIYPWGNEDPDCSLLNASPGFEACEGDTSQVGSTPAGSSPYGALDMAGNVYEWVADWYGEDYYRRSPTSNPTGPEKGEWRIVRGGAWHFNDIAVRTTHRQVIEPESSSITVGFRCAW